MINNDQLLVISTTLSSFTVENHSPELFISKSRIVSLDHSDIYSSALTVFLAISTDQQIEIELARKMSSTTKLKYTEEFSQISIAQNNPLNWKIDAKFICKFPVVNFDFDKVCTSFSAWNSSWRQWISIEFNRKFHNEPEGFQRRFETCRHRLHEFPLIHEAGSICFVVGLIALEMPSLHRDLWNLVQWFLAGASRWLCSGPCNVSLRRRRKRGKGQRAWLSQRRRWWSDGDFFFFFF